MSYNDAISRSRQRTLAESPTRGSLPDFMTNPNAVMEDAATWRHSQPCNYSNTNRKYMRERTNIWPPGSVEDLATNLINNWKKEASHKAKLQDLRTMNIDSYKFSCNGGRFYNAEEMMEIGTSNALIQEAAFYSAKHTSFDDSNKIFKDAMPDGFCWEVMEVYSGPPVMAFKWRHWGQMTGNLVCPIGPDTRLEAEATGQEVELWGLCVAHLDYDFRITKLEVFYDPHDLMASLVDANHLSYKTPGAEEQACLSSEDMRRQTIMDTQWSAGDGFAKTKENDDEEEDTQAVKALAGSRPIPPESTTVEEDQQWLQHEKKGGDMSPVGVGMMSPGYETDGMPSPRTPNGVGLGTAGGKANKTSRQPRAERDDSAFLHTVSGPLSNATKPHTSSKEASHSASQQSSPDEYASPSNGMVDARRGMGQDLPSDTALLSALAAHPPKRLPGSRCPFPKV